MSIEMDATGMIRPGTATGAAGTDKGQDDAIELVKRLRIMAGMLTMCERITFGEDAALMSRAADFITDNFITSSVPSPATGGAPAMRLALAALDVATTHLPEDRQAVLRAQAALRAALAATGGELDVEAERRAFEAWVRTLDVPDYALDRRDNGDYVTDSIDGYWSGWQARAATGTPAKNAPEDVEDDEPMSNHAAKGFPCLCCNPSNSPVGAAIPRN